MSQQKALHYKARNYLSEICCAYHPEEPHSSFGSPFVSSEFLAAAVNLSSSTANGSYIVVYLIEKEPRRPGLDFFTSSIYLGFCTAFLPLESLPLLFPSTKWENISTHLLPSNLFLISHISKLFDGIFLSSLLFLLQSNFNFSSHQAGFCPGWSTFDQIFIFLGLVRMISTNLS